MAGYGSPEASYYYDVTQGGDVEFEGVVKAQFGTWSGDQNIITDSEIAAILSQAGGRNLGRGSTRDGEGRTIQYFWWQRPIHFPNPGVYQVFSWLAAWVWYDATTGYQVPIWERRVVAEVTVT